MIIYSSKILLDYVHPIGMVIETLYYRHSRDLAKQFFQLALLEHMVVSLVDHCLLVGVEGLVLLLLLAPLLHLVQGGLVFELELEVPGDEVVLVGEGPLLLLVGPDIDHDLAPRSDHPDHLLQGLYTHGPVTKVMHHRNTYGIIHAVIPKRQFEPVPSQELELCIDAGGCLE